jgi:hypothetical protein
MAYFNTGTTPEITTENEGCHVAVATTENEGCHVAVATTENEGCHVAVAFCS